MGVLVLHVPRAWLGCLTSQVMCTVCSLPCATLPGGCPDLRPVATRAPGFLLDVQHPNTEVQFP